MRSWRETSWIGAAIELISSAPRAMRLQGDHGGILTKLMSAGQATVLAGHSVLRQCVEGQHPLESSGFTFDHPLHQGYVDRSFVREICLQNFENTRSGYCGRSL